MTGVVLPRWRVAVERPVVHRVCICDASFAHTSNSVLSEVRHESIHAGPNQYSFPWKLVPLTLSPERMIQRASYWLGLLRLRGKILLMIRISAVRGDWSGLLLTGVRGAVVSAWIISLAA
jgi:hypothetical protein